MRHSRKEKSSSEMAVSKRSLMISTAIAGSIGLGAYAMLCTSLPERYAKQNLSLQRCVEVVENERNYSVRKKPAFIGREYNVYADVGGSSELVGRIESAMRTYSGGRKYNFYAGLAELVGYAEEDDLDRTRVNVYDSAGKQDFVIMRNKANDEAKVYTPNGREYATACASSGVLVLRDTKGKELGRIQKKLDWENYAVSGNIIPKVAFSIIAMMRIRE